MVIFNIQAIGVALLAILFSIPFLIARYFNWIGDEMISIFVCWMILAASIVGKFNDMVGRLFFLPMWIISIPLPFLMTYVHYQWTGIATTFGVFLSPVILALLYVVYSDKKRVSNLRTETINLPNYEESETAYWTAVKDAIFTPTFMKMNGEIAQYNLRLANEVAKVDAEIPSLYAFKQEMTSVSMHSKKVDSDIVSAFKEEINMLIVNSSESLDVDASAEERTIQMSEDVD